MKWTFALKTKGHYKNNVWTVGDRISECLSRACQPQSTHQKWQQVQRRLHVYLRIILCT